MAELKRDFSQAKMNKDMDERIVAPGQYRDANNIQIATSDGSNVGTVQSLLGNTEVTENVVPAGFCTCVGAIEVPEKDLIYYFVSGSGNPWAGTNSGERPDVEKDYIIEYDTINKTHQYVFVDIFRVKATVDVDTHGSGENFIQLDFGAATNTSGIRTGMQITGVFTNNSGGNWTDRYGTVIANGSTHSLNVDSQVFVTDVVYTGSSNKWKIYHDYNWGAGATNFPVKNGDVFYFVAEGGANWYDDGRTLQFDPRIRLNAINYLDDMLFWTDGHTEPKKIHIGRSKAGTGGTLISKGWDDTNKKSHVNNTGINPILASRSFTPSENNANFHTRLTISQANVVLNYKLALAANNYQRVDVTREHITVVKKYPKFPLNLEMSTTSADRVPDGSLTPNKVSSHIADASGATLLVDFVDSSGDPLQVNDTISNYYFSHLVDFRRGDQIILTNDPGVTSGSDWDEDLTMVTLLCTYSEASINSPKKGPYSFSVVSVDGNVPNLAEKWFAKLKSPEPLFQFKFPRFSYRWKFEDGEYSAFAPWSNVAFLPSDFNYKAKEGYNTGMVNNIRHLLLKDYFHEFALVPRDVVGVDLLYKEDGKPTVYTVKSLSEKDDAPEWPDRTSNFNRGKFKITTEMIHAVVPSNQILRPWDNVPKSARAQEITANRLIYGNYKQGYNISNQIKIDVSTDHSYAGAGGPMTSIKTLRNYQVGITYSDEYGRETPVLVPKEDSTVTLGKEWSTSQNVLNVRLSPDVKNVIPHWAKYLKYYVKETSNEYYNLTQDRWYNAEDGNVWLSFPSAERNKVDEDTFLILKNEHDADVAVTDDSRYKIIAIENEAPNFVKTTYKFHGSATTTSQVGTTLAGNRSILIDDSDFTTGFGTKFMEEVYSKIARGTLHARIVGTVGTNSLTSKWVGVSKVMEFSANEHQVLLDQKLPEADMTSLLSGTIAYTIELRESTIENKPEFDGRFFVKILKDAALQDHIMKVDPSATDFIVKNSFEFRSILPPGSGSVATPWTSSGYKHHSVTTPTSGTHTYNTSNTWSASGGFDDDNKFGWCGGKSETKDFWQAHPDDGVFFIDGAAHSDDDINWSTGQSIEGDMNGLHNSHPNGNSSDARGIKLNTNKTAQIWFGVRGWGNDWIQITKDFHKAMTTPGTLFRFRDDPNGVVYKVKAYKGRKQVGNFVKSTWSCNRCKSGTAGCKRDIFSITFTRLDGTAPGTVSGQANTGVIDYNDWDPLSTVMHDGSTKSEIDILEIDNSASENPSTLSTNEPAIWETEPKEDVGLDIYYEASGAIPLKVTHKDNELLIPPGSTFRARSSSGWHSTDTTKGFDGTYKVYSVNSTGNPDTTYLTFNPRLVEDVNHDSYIEVTRYDGSKISLYVGKSSGNYTDTAITGSINATASTTVTGVGTAFTTEVAVGDRLVLYDGTNPAETRKVTAINSNTELIVDSAYTNLGNDTSPVIQNTRTIEIMTGNEPRNLVSNAIQRYRAPHHQPLRLGWHNCWRFGNGVESDRVRDDYNAAQVANGVKASTVMATPYAEEHKSSGLIFSGIFNSTSGVNDLNQFIQAEPITKDLNPRHGTIQALVTRDTNTVVFCEDKVLSVLTNKDALFNADGNANVTSNAAVLGQAVPMSGEYGISTNPESLAVTANHIYFCDALRGQVLQLTGNTITPISEIGMKDWFNDNLRNISQAVGSYDDHKEEYNLTLNSVYARNQYRQDHDYTISFNSKTMGWTSFKDFYKVDASGLEFGISLNNRYYTWYQGSMWEHHTNTTNTNFYGDQYYSDITTIFNDQPGSVKSFGTLNYEGSQARITQYTDSSVTNASGDTLSNLNDSEYYNLTAKTGWYVDSITTDLQETENLEFRSKENKWFSTIKGVTTYFTSNSDNNLDEREFSVQGLGNATISATSPRSAPFKLYVQPGTTNAANSVNWDSTADSTKWRIVQAAATNPTYHVETTTVAAGYRDCEIDNLETVNGNLVSSGFNLSAEDFEVPGGTVTTSGTGWATTYIYTAAAGWNADTTFSSGSTVATSGGGIWKVEFSNIGNQGPSNKVRVRIYFVTLTMPSNDVTYNVDIDVKSSVHLPPAAPPVQQYYNTNVVVSYYP